MKNYSYLNHLKTEFLGDEEELKEVADDMLRDFFRSRAALQSRAFLEEDLRYIVLQKDEGVKILEEEGEWSSGEIELIDGNKYELIYEENGYVRSEEIGAGEAQEYLH